AEGHEPDAVLMNLDLLRYTDTHANPRARFEDASTLEVGHGGELHKPPPSGHVTAGSSTSPAFCGSILRMMLDRFDKAILQALQHEGRIPDATLAERVNLSESACLRRVRALEESGLIEGYTALINQHKAGCPVNVFVNITLDRQDEIDLRKFEDAVRKIPEVMECYLMSGDFDYLIRVVVADTADFERLHSKHLTRLPGVARVHSSFALRTVQKTRELPIR